ncbi:GNAT family N-acetyltransferase [Dehalogenimonas alkenigignens]|uniref:GNAT family N-acetyltransferase n=1 Tax=Dehalogenimonas alkenigignens TaxID=1217799 RepID=UPI000D57AAC9|nr:GNAT family N-acetyltransferase [Dehalogenimonas alkenigignens]PVV83743.1 GNAT family N-acetyltransferase [Dehalogenimonas alkenigignens]
MSLRPLTAAAYDQTIALWQACEGIGLSDADSRCGITKYLERNPGCSFGAWDGERLVGAILGGHDGRRGYIHHLAVHPDYRKRGIGRRLAEATLSALKAEGINKCHLFIFNDNAEGIGFWESLGWTLRKDISVISLVLEKGTC